MAMALVQTPAVPPGSGPLCLEVLEGLDAYVHTEHFLHKLEQAKTEWMDLSGKDGTQMPMPPSKTCKQHVRREAGCEMTNMAHPAAAPSSRPVQGSSTRPQGQADLAEDFVVLKQEDAIEAMGYYIALYISRMPEAKNLEPKQLQSALTAAFKVIRRSKFKLVWDWGRWLYRWSAIGYSAVSLYENPWLVRAVVSAIWAASKMAFGHLW